MTNKVQNHLVEKFVSEVEIFLQDLNPELREDILREVRENLEARAEDNDAQLALPDSLEYANELRQAAGLDPVVAQKSLFKDFVTQLQARIRSNKFLMLVARFIGPFKPLFWLAVGISAYGFVDLYILGDWAYIGIPANLEQWLLWLALIMVSLWVGSAKFGPAFRRVRTVALTAAFLPLAIMFHGIAEGTIQTWDHYVNGNPALRTTGLIYNGMPVTNIFPYDADGTLLENVRLIDDMGRPLNSSAEKLVTPFGVDLESGNPAIGYLAPSLDEDSNRVWNVYPLKGSPRPEGIGYIRVAPPTVQE